MRERIKNLFHRAKMLIPRPLLRAYHYLQALIALRRYGNPSQHLTIVGVTGTDGKTTTTYMIYQIMLEAGLRAMQITSVGIDVYNQTDETIPSGLHATTPEPGELQAYLTDAIRRGCDYVVLETTSHGLDQFRVHGVKYHVGVITNVTREHLDYHKTYDKYLNAKARLLRNVEYSVINRDDASYQAMLKKAGGELISYGIGGEAALAAENIQMTPSGMTFDLPALKGTVKTVFVGEYNVSNALAAIGAARALGISDEVILRAFEKMKPPPGRLEVIDMGQDLTVIVDFAHTANGLDSVLKMLNAVKPNDLIVVFGCAGERDPEKRFPMGASAGRYADYAIITAEDPRTESLAAINKVVAAGVESQGGVRDETYFLVDDRAEAIRFAVQTLAKPGDIVVVTGKSHEQSMCYGTTEYPWDEFGAVRAAIAGRMAERS